ncbi:MAG: hypothetical protein FJY65_09095 [Calditrichaeota bacterium]|nr:hypothetical protein [Calditrichota bacterium]
MIKTKSPPDIVADVPISIDHRCCDLCGACVAVCPTNCIGMNEYHLWIIGSECNLCGLCLALCPVEALTWNEIPKPAEVIA